MSPLAYYSVKFCSMGSEVILIVSDFKSIIKALNLQLLNAVIDIDVQIKPLQISYVLVEGKKNSVIFRK